MPDTWSSRGYTVDKKNWFLVKNTIKYKKYTFRRGGSNPRMKWLHLPNFYDRFSHQWALEVSFVELQLLKGLRKCDTIHHGEI